MLVIGLQLVCKTRDGLDSIVNEFFELRDKAPNLVSMYILYLLIIIPVSIPYLLYIMIKEKRNENRKT